MGAPFTAMLLSEFQKKNKNKKIWRSFQKGYILPWMLKLSGTKKHVQPPRTWLIFNLREVEPWLRRSLAATHGHVI